MNEILSKSMTVRRTPAWPRVNPDGDMILGSVMLALTAFVPAMSKLHATGEVADNSIYNQWVWGVMYIIAAFKIPTLASVRAVMQFSWLLILFAGWMLLSTLWSVAPDVTIHESIELLGTTLVGVYLVLIFPIEKLLTVISYVIAAIAASSALLIIVAPARGRMTFGGGPWCGIYEDKNLLGAAMALGIISLITLALYVRGRSLLRVTLTTILCAAILVGANSMTSVAVCAITIIFMLTMFFLRSSKTALYARIGIVVFAIVALIYTAINGFQIGSIFDVLGRSSDLTGRTTFWPALWTAINDRPLVGYGYGAFFKSGIATNYLSDFLAFSGGWTPYHSHNSFLQVLINGGYVGLGLCVAVLLIGLFRGLTFAAKPGNSSRIWPVCIIVYLIVGSYSETYLGGLNNIEALLFIAAFLYPVRHRLLKLKDA